MAFFQNNWNVAIVTGAVIIILVAATLGYWLLNRLRPAHNLPKIGSRLQFAWIMTGVFALAVVFSRNYLLLFIAFISFLAFKEFLSVTPTRRADRRVLFFAYLAIPIQFYFIWQGWFAAFVAFLPLYLFLFLVLLMVVVGESQGFLKAYSTLNWGMLMTIYSLGYLAYLLALPLPVNPVAGGAGLFLFLIILTQLSDVAQFVFGRIFNRPWLRLKVSTTRTWASLAGSTGTSALLGWLTAPLLTPFTPAQAVGVGAIIAITSFVGYVTLAAIKQELHLKDRGTMTPGHGGMLNRIDSIIFTAPLYFYLIYYLRYQGG